MIHSIVEEHKVHSGDEIVVSRERLVQKLFNLSPVPDREVLRVTDAFRKVAVDNGLLKNYVFVVILIE